MEAKTVLVALGANLAGPDGQPPLLTCRWAAGQLAALPGLRLDLVSGWYRTAPVPPSGQPDYVNGVALLSGRADPQTLLGALHGIEARAGRMRGTPNAARTLDLDLLAMDSVVLPGPAPILPHPRLHERMFVLQPLCDVAPGWVHPVLGLNAAALLARLRQQGQALANPLPWTD